VIKPIFALGVVLTAGLSTAAIASDGYGYGYGYGYGGPASEDVGFYIGASAGEIFYKEQGLDTIAPSVAFLNVGVQFNPYLAVEGRIGGGIDGDDFRGYHVDVPLVYGGYVKGMLPVSPWFAPYAIAGVGGLQLNRNYPDFNSNDVAFSYGVGAEFRIYGGATIHAEWARMDHGTNDGYDYTADQLSVGVSFRL
jgi:hypothetical protein